VIDVKLTALKRSTKLARKFRHAGRHDVACRALASLSNDGTRAAANLTGDNSAKTCPALSELSVPAELSSKTRRTACQSARNSRSPGRKSCRPSPFARGTRGGAVDGRDARTFPRVRAATVSESLEARSHPPEDACVGERMVRASRSFPATSFFRHARARFREINRSEIARARSVALIAAIKERAGVRGKGRAVNATRGWLAMSAKKEKENRVVEHARSAAPRRD